MAKHNAKKILQCREHVLELGTRTLVMGVVNVTPDSFSDGGQFLDPDKAIAHGKRLAQEGADIIDIGGESTRPGSEPVPLEEELRRVIPVIEALAKDVKVPISIDTCKSKVAKAAMEAGAAMLNDVSALRFDPKIADVAVEYRVPLVLMHMKGTPKDMQFFPTYANLMSEIREFLRDRVKFAVYNGVDRNNIVIDPGIGFGKTVEHNLEIIRNLGELKKLKLPIIIGTSRKSFIGKILDSPPNDRLEGTLATVTMSILNGTDIVRVHDVKEVVRAVRITDAVIRG